MSNVYQFTCGGYEGCTWSTLCHDGKFTQEQIEQFVHASMCRAVVSMAVTQEYVGDIRSIWDRTLEELKATYGFKDLGITAEYSVFGWMGLTGEHWKGEQHGTALRALNALEAAGLTKEFFQAWSEAQQTDYLDWSEEALLGHRAGIAFRLNEALGYRICTVVPSVPLPTEEGL